MINIDIPEFDVKSYIAMSDAGGYKPNAMSQVYLDRLFEYFRQSIRLYGTCEEIRPV